MGPLYSFTRLTTACESKYYQELHFDSYLAPNCLAECLNVMESDPTAVIAYSHCQFVDESGNFLDLYQDTVNFAHSDPGQRYLNILSGMSWCTAYHGLWRHEVLAPLHIETMARRNAAFDNEFLALAALKGKLIQIPQTLFFRLKDDYQKGGESCKDRFNRLYVRSGLFPKNFFLPFCAWIRDHCQDVLESGLPLARKNELIQKTVSTLLKRYKPMLDYELGRAVGLVLNGDFAGGAAGPDETPPKGQYRYLDYAYLSQLMMDLEFAHQALRPDFPQLSLARAVVRTGLGQKEEALAALEDACRQNPADYRAQDLRARLEAAPKAGHNQNSKPKT